mmetsp:Transcript_8308/g.15125  ORF Transcript_8308/g.15125 Transcript_8308/m.15125 type:complete len:203 (-) Transcript_8308:121-729(-)
MEYNGGSTKSAGSDDLFVANIGTEDGSLEWMQQIGSSGKENMARNNGVFADMEGDCILYGDTTGELYRSRSSSEATPPTSDIFVVKLARDDGSFSDTLESKRQTGHFIGIGFGIVFFLLLSAGCGFILFPLIARRRKRSLRGKHSDVGSGSTSIFKDNPANSNGDSSASSAKAAAPDKSSFEMMPLEAYTDDPSYRPGRTII